MLLTEISTIFPVEVSVEAPCVEAEALLESILVEFLKNLNNKNMDKTKSGHQNSQKYDVSNLVCQICCLI